MHIVYACFHVVSAQFNPSGTVGQFNIKTYIDPDLCPHMVSLGHIELIQHILLASCIYPSGWYQTNGTIYSINYPQFCIVFFFVLFCFVLVGLMMISKELKWTIDQYSSKLLTLSWGIDSMAPGRFERIFIQGIFKLILVICEWGISCKTAINWMSLDFTDDKSSHYRSQCWPRSLLPYGVIRPQWVNYMK